MFRSPLRISSSLLNLLRFSLERHERVHGLRDNNMGVIVKSADGPVRFSIPAPEQKRTVELNRQNGTRPFHLWVRRIATTLHCQHHCRPLGSSIVSPAHETDDSEARENVSWCGSPYIIELRERVNFPIVSAGLAKRWTF